MRELADAVASQSSFVGRVLRLGPRVIDDAYVERAIERYGQFLALAKEQPDTLLVPTLDVDLIWHVHMLSPVDYREDCEALLGRQLKHDATLPAATIEDGFKATQQRWQEAFGLPFTLPAAAVASGGIEKHGDEKRRQQEEQQAGGCGVGLCGSCGWDLNHSTLTHQQIDARQIEAAYPAEETANDPRADDAGFVDRWAQPPEASENGSALNMVDPWAEPVAADVGGLGHAAGCGGGGCGGGCGLG